MDGLEYRLGEKIRKKRKELGLTLDRLATQSMVARTTISKIERDIISPSFNTLAKIARGMNVKLTSLINGDSDEKEILIRKKDRKIVRLKDSLCEIESLTKSTADMQCEVTKHILGPGGDSGMDPPHPGEEVIICLKGIVEFQIGDKIYRLKNGDSIHFKPTHESCLFNRTSKEARVLWVYAGPLN